MTPPVVQRTIVMMYLFTSPTPWNQVKLTNNNLNILICSQSPLSLSRPYCLRQWKRCHLAPIPSFHVPRSWLPAAEDPQRRVHPDGWCCWDSIRQTRGPRLLPTVCHRPPLFGAHKGSTCRPLGLGTIAARSFGGQEELSRHWTGRFCP